MANMDQDPRSNNARSLRCRDKNARPRYVNDLPDETVKALARLTHHDGDDEVLAPPRKKARKESTKDVAGTNEKLTVMACDTKPQPPKTTGRESPSSQPRLNEIDSIKAKIATEHEYSRVLTEERRNLWAQMESHEARIREHQRNISESNEAVDLINRRFSACEMQEKNISKICDRLWTLAGELDNSAVVVGQLLGELVVKSQV